MTAAHTAGDAWTIARRDLQRQAKQPWLLAVNLLFPILIMLMFGFLFGGSMVVPGGGDYIDFLLPGVFVATMFFGVEATALAVVHDSAKGITDRLRSLPIHAASVLAGRSIADMLNATAGLVVLVVCALLVGWEPNDTSFAEAAAGVGLLLLLRYALIWVGIYLGLLLKTPEAAMSVQILVWPAAFLSGAYTPSANMPDGVRLLAELNPISSTATAVRELFGNPTGARSGAWVTEHAVELAIAWPLAIVVLFVPLAARRYRALGG